MRTKSNKTVSGQGTAQNIRASAVQRADREVQDGSLQAGAFQSSSIGSGLYLLAKRLRSLPLFEMAIITGETRNKEGLLRMINTEEKQLQAIEDLYHIVKAQPKYKTLKEPVWNESTRNIDVLYWLLRKLGPLAKGNPWTVDTYEERGKVRFRFVVWCEFSRNDLKAREEYMPLDFLPMLLKRDKDLHDLIIDIVALTSKRNKIPLWHEDGDYSEHLEAFSQEPFGIGGHRYDNQRYTYTQGIAATYLQLLIRRRRTVKAADIWEKIAAYELKSDRKRNALWWIREGLRLAESGGKISDFTYVPNYVIGTPITPFRLYKFVWSIHKHDIIDARVTKRYMIDKGCGYYLPVRFSIAKPGKLLPKLPDNYFPEALYEFLDEGVKHFCWRFRDYYYKDKIDAPTTPAEFLLDQIERAEIEQLRIDNS